MNWEGFGSERVWLKRRYHSGIYEKRLRETRKKKLSKNSVELSSRGLLYLTLISPITWRGTIGLVNDKLEIISEEGVVV
jgi:hypothetical protein